MLTRRHRGPCSKKCREDVCPPLGGAKKGGPLITEALPGEQHLFVLPCETCHWFNPEIIGLIFIMSPSFSVFPRLRRCWRSERGGKQTDCKLKTVLNGAPQYIAVILTPRTTMKSGDSSQGVEDYRQKFAKGKDYFFLYLILHPPPTAMINWFFLRAFSSLPALSSPHWKCS